MAAVILSAEKLYRQGNVVRVVGQLDCRMEYQGGEAVRLKLAEIDAEWAERKAELAGKPGELRRAETAYLRVRQRFEAAPRLYVLTGCAELLAGEVTGIEATYQARRHFVRSRRQQQTRVALGLWQSEPDALPLQWSSIHPTAAPTCLCMRLSPMLIWTLRLEPPGLAGRTAALMRRPSRMPRPSPVHTARTRSIWRKPEWRA